MDSDQRTDRRGATGVTVAGLLTFVACVVYLATSVRVETLPSVLAIAGAALAMFIAGLLRRWTGRALPGAVERLRAAQDAPGPVTTGLARLFALIVDFGGVLAIALGAFQLFRLVRDDANATRLCSTISRFDLSGLAFLRAYAPCFTGHGADDLSGGIAALACTLFLLLPAAVWGATPGLLLIGRVWVRGDGARVGALHGIARVLTGVALAPLQAFFTVRLFFNFANRYRNLRTGERFTVVGWGLLRLLRRPRTFADMLCRVEAIPRR